MEWLGINSKKPIGIIARGMSLEKLPIYSQEYNQCFLVGKHFNSMRKLDYCINNKKIISIMPKKILTISKELCDRLNIEDVQTQFDPGNYRLEKISKICPWLNYHPVPEEFRKKMLRDWWDTGGFAVSFVSCYRPPAIMIIGLDFYATKYFARENPQSFSIKHRMPDLMKFFYKVCNHFPEIKYYLYTYNRKMKSRNNLKVIHINDTGIAI